MLETLGLMGASAALGAGSSVATGILGNYFGKKQAEQSFSNYKKQAAYDYMLAKGPYFDLSRKYDEKNYQLARRYSENSASWARRGLEAAGLNPILAASQGFNANMGFQGQQIDPKTGATDLSVKAPSLPRVDPTAFFQMANTAKQTDANVGVADAEQLNLRSQAFSTFIKAINDAGNGGVNNWSTLLNRFLQDLGDGAHTEPQADALRKMSAILGVDGRGDFEKFIDNIRGSNWIGSMFGSADSSSSAKQSVDTKDASTAKDVLPKIVDRFFGSPSPSAVRMSSPRWNHELNKTNKPSQQKRRHN